MKKQSSKIYLNSTQIYKYDQITTEKFLIPSFVLMENAGKSIAEIVKKFAQRNNLKKIIIFCGPGKNGGDGFVLARYLYIWCFEPKVIIFTDEKNYKNDALQNYNILKKLGVNIEKFNVEKIKKEIAEYDIIVDAIFGIGLKREVENEYKDAIELINKTKKTVFSIDIPSGIQSDTAEILGCCVKADYTLTIGFLKLAFKNKEAKKFCGKIKLIDIGYPKIEI
ncbi:MAG: NAD(P)H-hydrate epimerase [Endomicrobiia bacterium]